MVRRNYRSTLNFREKTGLTLLAEKLGTRQNNLTPVRLILAWLVLYGHSYGIARNAAEHDQVSQFFNHTWIGAIAVEIFFALSGMRCDTHRDCKHIDILGVLGTAPDVLSCFVPRISHSIAEVR